MTVDNSELIAKCHEEIRHYKNHIAAAQKRLASCPPKLRPWHNGAIQAYQNQIERVQGIIKMYQSKEQDKL